MKEWRARIVVGLLSISCWSCSPYVFPHAEPVKSKWNVTLEFDTDVPAATHQGIKKEFDRFIANSQTSSVKFTSVADSTTANMKISVKGFNGISGGAQALGVASCVLGVITAGIGFGIVSVPVTSSTSQLYVYDGEDNTHVRRKTQFVTGPGFLKRQRMQRIKHSKGYRKYFRKVSKWYEKDLATAKRKGTLITDR